MSQIKQSTNPSSGKIVWSALYDLANYATAPTEEGIYVVGVYNGPANRPAAGLPCSDHFLGDNWPDGFVGYMVGRAYKTTIRTRLKDHFDRSSNQYVRDYLKINGEHSLSYIYIEKKNMYTFADPRFWEHTFLTMADFEWNIHRRESKSFEAATKELLDEMMPTAVWAHDWDPTNGL